MEKTKVVIASVLKPIDDTRMFEKFGLSMAKTNKYAINIIGFASKNVRSHEGIQFHDLGNFPRLSWARYRAKWKVYRQYLKVRPHIIIVNTHELLIVTVIFKIFFGAKIVYDVRENYLKNTRHTQAFPTLLRPFISTWVRLKEIITKPFFNRFILAERVYARQMGFLPASATIVENKYKALEPTEEIQRPLLPDTIDLVYTGTISRGNGAFEAISIAKALHKLNPAIRLKLVGYCAIKNDLKDLQEAIQEESFIELIGGDYLVPHEQIVKEIANADFGFVLKKPNNGINDEKLLTRLFEYTAHHLPILMLNNPTWISFCNEFNAAIAINPADYDPKALLDQMLAGGFYSKGDTSSSLWETEEARFLSLIDELA